jgi:hypothetical protein
MNKFHSILNRKGDAVLKDRAENIAKLAEMSQDSLVKRLEKERIELEFKQKELLDMSPDNRYDLKVGKDFRADQWVNDYHNVSVSLIENEIALEVAKKNMTELFSEQEGGE